MRFENVPARYKSYWVNEDYAGQFATQRAKFPLDFPTGEKHIYNNTNYMLLGLVLERVAKKSFGTVIREEVFGPAGMKNSFVYESPKAVPAPAAEFPRAVGYEKQDNGSWKAGWGCPPNRDEDFLTVGDGGVWTNLDDMAAWDAALRAGKLLKAETMKLALTPSKTRDGKTNQYGFGWVLYPGQAGGMNGYGHDGEWRGFRTSYYRYLVTNRSTVVLSNRGDFDTDKFWYALNETVEKALKKK
jgi:CubicO group peptidase (beta-lactamase class C family)